jgi:hypothetical protein
LKVALYVSAAYLATALTVSILVDTLLAWPVTKNWCALSLVTGKLSDTFRSVEHQAESIWNSYTDFLVNWILNISSDILRTSDHVWCLIEVLTLAYNQSSAFHFLSSPS